MKECFECGSIVDVQEHHIVPKSRGGTRTVPLCHTCHLNAHGRDGNGMNHSQLIKEAYRRKKARGEPCGNLHTLVQGRATSAQRRSSMADDYAMKLAPLIMTDETLQQVANKLMQSGIKTRRGNENWSATTVRAMRLRVERIRDNKQQSLEDK